MISLSRAPQSQSFLPSSSLLFSLFFLSLSGEIPSTPPAVLLLLLFPYLSFFIYLSICLFFSFSSFLYTSPYLDLYRHREYNNRKRARNPSTDPQRKKTGPNPTPPKKSIRSNHTHTETDRHLVNYNSLEAKSKERKKEEQNQHLIFIIIICCPLFSSLRYNQSRL